MEFAATTIEDVPEPSSCYRYLSVTGGEAVDLVLSGRWDLPGFQRAFVWRPQQVSDLVDSLWRGFPIGQLLLWKSLASAADTMWIADGQQRLTSLCLLFGVRPPWWEKREIDRRNLNRHFDLRFDIQASAPPLFHCSYEGEIEDPAGRLLPVREILAHDPASEGGRAALRAMAVKIKRCGLCRDVEEDRLYRTIYRVAMIRHLPLCAICAGCGVEEVLEIFERLNSRGSRFRRLLLNLAMRSLVSASQTRLPMSRRKTGGVEASRSHYRNK